MWIINGLVVDVVIVWVVIDDGICGFIVFIDILGFIVNIIGYKLLLWVLIISELVFDNVWLFVDVMLFGVIGFRVLLVCLLEVCYGIVWGVMGVVRLVW